MRWHEAGCICTFCEEERRVSRDKAAEMLRAGRTIKPRQSAPEIKAQNIIESLSNGPQSEREMKWPEEIAPEMVRRAVESFLAQPLCVHTRKKEAREPAPTHLTADRLALVGVILSMLRDKLPSNAVRIAVEIEFADGGECKMESKA